jgi:hypothetical protein
MIPTAIPTGIPTPDRAVVVATRHCVCGVVEAVSSGEADFFTVPIEPEDSLFYDWTNPNFPTSPVLGGRKA